MKFSISTNELAFLNEKMERLVEARMFELVVGTSSVEVQTVMLEVQGLTKGYNLLHECNSDS